VQSTIFKSNPSGKTLTERELIVSETLWGVIVGGLIVVIGSIVASLFQNHQTRISINARKEEQERQFEFENNQKSKQLEFEKNQVIMAHLIEERKKWIEPLRKSLTAYSIGINDVYLQLIIVHYSIPDNSTDGPLLYAGEKEQNSLNGPLDRWGKSSNQLSDIMAQISDQSLERIVSELVQTNIVVSGACAIKINRSWCVEFEQQLDEARDKTASAFKRMEDLLSGKE
jgi:hypothetical protein